MSYTGSHLQNFISLPTATASSTGDMPTSQQDRREVRPLGGGDNAVSKKQAHAANLEAQVRVLEQEVHLLRTGLAQSDAIRQISTPAAPQRRVHFGPSSIVPIPRATPSAASSSALGLTRKPSKSPSRLPRRQPSPSTAAAPTVSSSDDRPRLAFGQRVNPSVSRTTLTAAAGSTSTNSRQPLMHLTLKKEEGLVMTQSNATEGAPRPVALAAEAPSNTANTTYVHLSPAPASLRGSNTAGIPLQGAAAGATVVSAVEGVTPPLSSSSGATLWASADPSLLWKRAAAANGGNTALDRADVISGYPFRTSSAPTVTGAPTPASAVSAAPSPILVTMSSEGLLPSAAQQSALASAATSAPAVAAAESNAEPPKVSTKTAESTTQSNCTHGNAPSSATTTAGTPIAVPAAASLVQATNESQTHTSSSAAISCPPNAKTEASIEEMRLQIMELRDNLGQREALLQRVLVELHSRGSTAQRATAATASSLVHQGALEDKEQSRRTLRLLTEELLAAQTQLSHAKVSYQLLQAELQRQQQRTPPASPPAVADSAPPPPPPPPGTTTTELQTQLDAALQKVKAWEDWYASTAPTETKGSTGEAAASAAQAATEFASSKPAESSSTTTGKRKRKVHHAAEEEQNNAAHGPSHRNVAGRTCLCCCPSCGATLSGASEKAFYSAEPPFTGLPSTLNVSATAAAPALISAYAVGDALYSKSASNMCPLSSYQPLKRPPAPSAAAATAATPPPQLQAHASASPQEPARATKRTPTASPVISRNAMHSGRDASLGHPVTWESGVGLDHRRGVNGAPVPPSVSYYCNDLEHAKMQAYYYQQYTTQVAREAAVRELAETERQVAEERLAVLRRQRLSCTPPSLSPTPRADGSKTNCFGTAAAAAAAAAGAGSTAMRETVDDR